MHGRQQTPVPLTTNLSLCISLHILIFLVFWCFEHEVILSLMNYTAGILNHKQLIAQQMGKMVYIHIPSYFRTCIFSELLCAT